MLREKIVKATNFRREILDARDDVNYEALSYSLSRADDQLEYPRIYGDLVLSAFFAGDNKARRKGALQRFAVLRENGEEAEFKRITEEMRTGEKPLVPFHWEIEFPEVFQLDTNLYVRGGFDAVVGNPPFMGGRLISGVFSDQYLAWLIASNPNSGGQADLVGYFFRRAYGLLSAQRSLGMVATNTIAQGDTRQSSLLPIIRAGGKIYNANRRVKWPGEAAVTVSTLCISKGPSDFLCTLDGETVNKITAFLVQTGPDENPESLSENEGLSFKGMEPYGHGFFFDDSDPEASRIATKDEIVTDDQKYAQFIHPYIGGDELLSDPQQRSYRFVIDFADMRLAETSQYPELLSILEKKVRPERATKAADVAAAPWWKFWRVRNELRRAISGMKSQLVHPFTSTHLAFSYVPTSTVVSTPHCVIASERHCVFAVLQSRLHEVWARSMASSLEDRLRYTPSDCFETFAFPEQFKDNSCLEEIGRTYYDFRADLMIRNDEGLTKTYNRFHNPNERSADIKKLRELHDQMDRAVLDAYGWTDIRPVCEFFPEFEDDEEDESESRRPRTKKYRYRWPDEIHDEVLARLLALNQERAAQGR
jgi:hypothetical protein